MLKKRRRIVENTEKGKRTSGIGEEGRSGPIESSGYSEGTTEENRGGDRECRGIVNSEKAAISGISRGSGSSPDNMSCFVLF